MMKTIFSILLLSLAAATAAEAQSLEAFKQRLVGILGSLAQRRRKTA